jgi:hypothetical protein
VPYEGCTCTSGGKGNEVSIDSLIFYFLIFLVGCVGCMRYAILCW